MPVNGQNPSSKRSHVLWRLLINQYLDNLRLITSSKWHSVGIFVAAVTKINENKNKKRRLFSTDLHLQIKKSLEIEISFLCFCATQTVWIFILLKLKVFWMFKIEILKFIKGIIIKPFYWLILLVEVNIYKIK